MKNNPPSVHRVVTDKRVELHSNLNPAKEIIYVDFVEGALVHRARYGGGRHSQLISRAVGANKKKHLKVLDLTAGLGRDAFLLATLGCEVTMCERNPIIAALLKDGLKRAAVAGVLKNIKLQLIEKDARDYLTELTPNQFPEVIYIDPMFPDLNKTALVKKEMRVLRQVVGDDVDASELFSLAEKYATKRIVVKRARHAPPIIQKPPSVVFNGKSNRFDVWVKP